jgi:hypothetical protein
VTVEKGCVHVEKSPAGRPATGHEVRPPAKEDAETKTAETGKQKEVNVFQTPEGGHLNRQVGDQIAVSKTPEHS